MKKHKSISKFFEVMKYICLIGGTVCTLVPVWVCVLTAFKTNQEYASTSALDLPASFLYWDNFSAAIEKTNMLSGFFNTGLVLIVVLVISIFMGSMLAYVLNRFRFPGRGIVQNLFIFAALLPGIAMQVTVYQIMYSLNLISLWIYDRADGN